MRYPTMGVIGITSLDQVKELNQWLKILNIAYRPEGIEDFWIDGYKQSCMFNPPPSTIPLYSYEEFIFHLSKFHRKLNNFISNLRVGDQVVIEKRRDFGSYPEGFTRGMTKYSGRIMTIKKIVTDVGKGLGFRFANGDANRYYLEEDKENWLWHSSMFELKEPVKINKISFSNISINPLTL